ncbi:hypothetical protein FGO68_gene3980 [Halteria grandinella]|uniref:Uncharacterized protein n=1 Tax=Halteria grandinella TaxID=5974 RepID=A0A8J8SYI3_HALGN|nr:hypothetical protein FGO68_gene3980 [Halteria grandinella]
MYAYLRMDAARRCRRRRAGHAQKSRERRLRLARLLPPQHQPALRRRSNQFAKPHLRRQMLRLRRCHEGRPEPRAHEPDGIGAWPDLLRDPRRSPRRRKGREDTVIEPRIVRARKEHEARVRQLTQPQRLARSLPTCRQRMRARQQDAVALPQQLHRPQPRRRRIRMKKTARDLARLQRRELFRGRRLREFQADARVLLVKLAQYLRQHRRHRETREGHLHMPDFAPRQRRQIVGQGSETAQQRLASLEQQSACRRQLHAASGAIEQPHFQRAFELRDSARECRLRDGQRLRCLSKMQLARDFSEVYEVAQLKGELILTRHHRTLNKYFRLWQLFGRLGPFTYQVSPTLFHRHAQITLRKSLGRALRPQAGQWPDPAPHRHAPHP